VKEHNDIIRAYDQLDKLSTSVALATVIDIEGSSYRRTGARMLIQDNGVWTGGISGGCIEGNALKKAYMAIAGKKAVLVTYDTANEDEEQIGVSLGCNGIIKVIISPINYADKYNPLEQLRACTGKRVANLLITVIEADTKLPLSPGDVLRYSSADDLQEAFGSHYIPEIRQSVLMVLESEKSAIIEFATCKLFLEFIPPAIQLLIMGSHYDVYPLLKIARQLDWHNVVIANPGRLSTGIHQLASQVTPDFRSVNVDKYTVAILMSHDYKADLNNLAKALSSELRYIGLLGPASRKDEMLAELPFPVEESHKQRLFGPAGLDIGAAQPEEIAISIIAEILAVLRNREGGFLRERLGPIYNR
jgi:xanthine dehydrogenase accessory factor